MPPVLSLFRSSPCTAVLFAAIAASCFAPPRDLPPPRPAMLQAVHAVSPHRCNAQTAAALDAVGIEPGEVAEVTYSVNSTSADRGSSVGIDAYVRLKDQSGSVVVQHRGGCNVGGVYATGSVRLPRQF